MSPVERLRLEKAAADCGFERTPALLDDGGVELRSAQFPESIVVHTEGYGFRISASSELLMNDSGVRAVSAANLDQLYITLQRASAIARTMPNRVAGQFRRITQQLPQTTEAERLVVQRVGQDLFRNSLIEYWEGRCCVTGLAVPALLRASHIKPWAKCQSDDERLDVFNGLLLAPHVDALFDGGWISFSDEGSVLVSSVLPVAAKAQLGLSSGWAVRNLKPAHLPYLRFHRNGELRTVF
jgi:putative restriction endonuclease